MLVPGDQSSDLMALKERLVREDYEVLSANDGPEVLKSLDSARKPDIVLLGIEAPDNGGLATCERIRTKAPGVVLILLSDSGSEADTIKGLDAGADDYVRIPFSLEVLLARIRSAVRSRLSAAGYQQLLEVGDLQIDVRNYLVRVKGRWTPLPPQEFRLLTVLARSAGEPLSRQELALRAGGRWRDASGHSVTVHVSRIRAAVEKPSDYTYIHNIRGFGYRFKPVLKRTPEASATLPAHYTEAPQSG